MKSFTIASVLGTSLLMALSAPLSAFAFDGGIKANIDARIERKDDRKEKMASTSAAKQEKREDRQEDRKEKIASSTEARQGRLHTRIDKLNDHFVKKINELERLNKRVITRIDFFASKGATTTEARSHTTAATEKIAALRLKLTQTNTQADASIEATTTAVVKVVVPLYKEIQNGLNGIHKEISLAVRALKGASASLKASGHATTTATTTNQ